MEDKYKLIKEDSFDFLGTRLYRIEALRDFGNVKKGDKGGYIENERNLFQKGNCWISGSAFVYGNAQIFGNALVYDNAEVYGNAQVYGNAEVYDNAHIYDHTYVHGNAKVYGGAVINGNAQIFGNAEIKDNSDYIVFKNWWSSGRHFTWTRSNNMWKVGCFYGTGKELIAKAYTDSDLSGREYRRVVNYVESILRDNK